MFAVALSNIQFIKLHMGPGSARYNDNHWLWSSGFCHTDLDYSSIFARCHMTRSHITMATVHFSSQPLSPVTLIIASFFLSFCITIKNPDDQIRAIFIK